MRAAAAVPICGCRFMASRGRACTSFWQSLHHQTMTTLRSCLFPTISDQVLLATMSTTGSLSSNAQQDFSLCQQQIMESIHKLINFHLIPMRQIYVTSCNLIICLNGCPPMLFILKWSTLSTLSDTLSFLHVQVPRATLVTFFLFSPPTLEFPFISLHLL